MGGKRNKALMAVVLLAMVAFSFSAADAARTKIVYMHDTANGTDWLNWLKDAKAQFEAAYPDVEVEIMVPASRNDQLEKITSMYAAGVLPDVIETFPSTGYTFASQGVFQDLNPFMARESNLAWTSFFPVAVDSATFTAGPRQGARWFMPFSMWSLGFAFNLDRFAEVGLRAPVGPDASWTWNDFRTFGQKLVKYGSDGKVEKYATWILSRWDRWLGWVYNAGDYPFDRWIFPTTSNFRTASVRKTLELWQDMYLKMGFAGSGGGEQRFAEQQAAFIVAGPSYTPQYKRYNGNFAYGFGTNPKEIRAGSESLAIGAAMGAQTKHPAEAWNWIKWICTNAADEHIAMTGRPSPWAPAARRYLELFPGASPWEYVWIDLVMSPDGYTRPVVDTQVSTVIDKNLSDIVKGTIDAGTAIERLSQQVQALLLESAQK